MSPPTAYLFYICLFCIIFSSSLGGASRASRRFPPPINTNNNVKLNCKTIFTDEIIQLIIDYALWRNVAMLYIIDESIKSVCNMKTVRLKLDCFNENGLSITLQKRFHVDLKPSSRPLRILVVSFIRANMDYDKYLDQVNRFSHERFKWLNIYSETENSTTIAKSIFDTLKHGALTLWSDVAVVVATANSTNVDKTLLRRCKRPKTNVKSPKEVQVEMLLPFNDGRNHSGGPNVTFGKLCEVSTNSTLGEKSFCVLQVYKIRKSNNASLVIRPLGYWNYKIGTEGLKPHQSIEERIDFHGFPLIFGKKRFSQESNIVSDESIIEDDNDEENMEKISEFITSYLNATSQVKMYTTLGLKGPSGNWSGLLGAVVSQDVDIGLDSVIEVPERYNDMAFTQNIMRSIRNIYLRPEESHNPRDLFAAPFDTELALSTLGTSLIFSVAMAIYILKNRINFYSHAHDNSYFRAFSDAVVWVIGVCTMQGTIIQPRSPSGNLIIVISLLYALLLFNSYSAFITSVLSVKLIQIRTVEDLLDSDYDIGYTKNSQDEIFLRSMNQSHLNQIYLRGYLHNNINNVTDGLLKATKGNYGFFATGQVARKQFLKISGYKCKYDIMEMPIPSTRNSIAFPMSLESPYRKVINYCLMKMSEAGVHQYITSQIAPQLPKCDQFSSYQSVRINDLTTPYGLLLIGLLIGLVVLLLEYFWKNKRRIYFKLRGNQNRGSTRASFAFIH